MAKTVLIAEDEPHIVESLTFLLSRAGHRVESVRDGAAAVDAAIARPPDLVVLDVMMPSLNGFDVLKRLRATPGFERLPVLALTAKGQDADSQRMLDLGADDFVTKPFSNRDLIERVDRLLNGDGKAAGVVG
jgi:DNA-binding response OmpR family regulator